MSEVRSVLSSMGTGKAAGWDRVSSEVFKSGPQCLLDLLLVLFNRVKNSSTIPRSWKRGRLVLIHKKRPTTDAFNYRPLSILTFMSTINTKLLNSRLAKVVKQHGLLSEIQHGFHKELHSRLFVYPQNHPKQRRLPMGTRPTSPS